MLRNNGIIKQGRVMGLALYTTSQCILSAYEILTTSSIKLLVYTQH